MKKQEIRSAYTQKVTELLNQGYTVFPDTMGGSQGEIAHIDLTNGSEILRVLLERKMLPYGENGEGYWDDAITLTVGRAAADTRIGCQWNGTIWNNRLERIFQIDWAELSCRGEGWYTSLEEGAAIGRKRMERYRRKNTAREDEASEALKSAALRWLRKQPRMKSCRLEDISGMVRCTLDDGTRYYRLTAKGRTYTLLRNR